MYESKTKDCARSWTRILASLFSPLVFFGLHNHSTLLTTWTHREKLYKRVGDGWNNNHFYLRNRKHVPCFYRVIQTRMEIWENEKCCGNTSRRRVFPQLFRVLPDFHECLYNSIETRSTCFLFLLENNATRKWKTTC